MNVRQRMNPGPPPPETNPHSQNPPSSQSVKLRDKRFFTTNLGSKCSPRMSIFYVNTDLKKTKQNLAGSCLESQTCQSVLKTSCTRCVSLQLFVSHLVSRTKYHNAQIAVVATRAVRLLSQCEALKGQQMWQLLKCDFVSQKSSSDVPSQTGTPLPRPDRYLQTDKWERGR